MDKPPPAVTDPMAIARKAIGTVVALAVLQMQLAVLINGRP